MQMAETDLRRHIAYKRDTEQTLPAVVAEGMLVLLEAGAAPDYEALKAAVLWPAPPGIVFHTAPSDERPTTTHHPLIRNPDRLRCEGSAVTVTDLPPAWELTTESFYDWCVANHATEPGFSGPQRLLVAPAGPIDEVAPPSLASYIGQETALDELMVHIGSAKARGAGMPATLLAAPAGYGKTTLARTIAHELGRPFVEITRPTQATQLAEKILAVGPGPAVVFIDEVHLWKAKAQHDLMDLTDTNSLVTDHGRIDFPGLTVLAATTEPQALIGPLSDRFGCIPRFGPYSDSEMAQIVAGMAYRAGLEPDHVSIEFQEVLGRASAGHPRSARHLVLAARSLLDVGRDCTASTVLAFTRTEADGMTAEHLEYLAVLAGSVRDAVGVPTLAHLLGVDTRRLARIERLLIDRGYVALGVRGRQITPAGRRRLMETS